MSGKILYISYDGMTDPLGQSQVLPYISGLSSKGYRFVLISFEKKERYFQHKTIIEQLCFQSSIEWVPLFYTKKPPVLSTLWDIIRLKYVVQKLQKKHSFQGVHCRSYLSSMVGLSLKKKRHIPFIFDMRGFWADERVDGNLWDLKNPIYRMVYTYFKKKEREFLRYADAVVSLTEAGKKEILKWKVPEVTDEKIWVIPCAADYDVFTLVYDERRKKAKQNLGLSENTFVLSYLGSLGTWYLLEEMLIFFKILKEKLPNAVFLFITPEPRNFILTYAQKLNISENDIIVEFSPRNLLESKLHASDYSIFFIKPSYSKISSSPTKMGELLAMGIPVICNNIGDVKNITQDIQCGLCLDALTIEEYKKTIYNLTQHLPSNPIDLRENSKKYYWLNTMILKYEKIYQRLF